MRLPLTRSSPLLTDIYANRYGAEALLRLQKRSGPYISPPSVFQHQLFQAQPRYQPSSFNRFADNPPNSHADDNTSAW